MESSTHQSISLSLQETSYGVLRPPLGSVRLTIIELVAVLLRTGSEEAEGAIIESSAVQEVLQVFLRFPFNSILHHQASPYPYPQSGSARTVLLSLYHRGVASAHPAGSTTPGSTWAGLLLLP